MTQSEWEAVNRHIMTGLASAVAGAAAMGFVSGTDAATLTRGFSLVSDAVAQIGQGIALVTGVVVPVIVAYRAKHLASPQAQVAAVAAQEDKIVVTVDPAHSAAATMKVAELPQVKEVVTSDEDARAIPMPKVVGVNGTRDLL